MINQHGISYKLINSTTLELNTQLYVDCEENDYEIVKLKIKDKEIKLKDTFKFEVGDSTITYEVNHINKISKGVYLLHTELRNKTTQYLLPILGKFTVSKKNLRTLNRADLSEILDYCTNTYLVNAYLEGGSIDTLSGYMYLKMKFSPLSIYQIFEETVIETHPLFVKIIDNKDSYIYFKFVIPKEFLPDIKTFLQGRYSEMSMDLKKRIIHFYKLTVHSNFYHILEKEGKYKEDLERELGVSLEGLELDSSPDIEKELIQL